MMEKTSFSEICKILENNEYDKGVRDCVNGFFEIALLFLPGLICKDVSFMMNLVNGATILGAKPIIESAIKNIANVFSNRKYDDFSTKYEHAQIAQVLIVYAAYFDAIKNFLPDEERKIKISNKEKIAIAEESISKYNCLIKENLTQEAGGNLKTIFKYELPMPNPIESIQEYKKSLKHFYSILNDHFMLFYDSLELIEKMNEGEREKLAAVMRELPDQALKNYEKQYYQLAVNFNDFFVWTNIEEHKKMQKRLDVGFEEISKSIVDYCEKSVHSKATSTLENYRKKYSSYIETSVVEASEMNYASAEDIVFPSKREIFVPQSYKTITYKNNMHLEDKSVWKGLKERTDIGKFIGDVLRHSINGSLPLLILGPPGAGKSLLCNMLAAQILYHEYHVIIVKLRDSIAEQTIVQQINQQIERDFSNGCLWSDIVESHLAKPMLIIFDGYDELLQASGKSYSDYLQKIVEFQEAQRNIHGMFVKCIVTSRITLIDKAEISKNTPVMMLSDFDQERVYQWSRIWNEKNSDYFNANGLEKFKISHSDKVFDLAKQPLLLLMLALYDSNDNALKKNKNMDETELYDNLIREFISREKRKDGGFRSLQLKKQESEINQEIERISIAAIGMYNRKKLHIRSNEFENDLQYMCQEKKKGNEPGDIDLLESEKLIGSFFFIHKSIAVDKVDGEKVLNTAYEFLHNTFGEFLTANYMVGEINSTIFWIHTLVEANRKEQWKLGNQRTWVVSMAYAPLFSRPVVIKMVHEWASVYFKKEKREAVNDGLSYLLELEIENIVSGNAIFDLKEVMEEKDNQFTHDEFFKHLGIYCVNLIIIRTIILGSEYRFGFCNKTWNKIFEIWKYAFSEDELLSFSNQFVINKLSEAYEVKYIGERKDAFEPNQKKISQYMQINSVTGDSALYGIMGAIIGEADRRKVMEAIWNNKLKIEGRYLWNYCLNILVNSGYESSIVLEIIHQMNRASFEEGDNSYFICSYILLEKLLNTKAIKTDEYSCKLIEKMITGLIEDFDYDKLGNDKIIWVVLDTIEKILNYVQLHIVSLEKLLTFILSERWNRVDAEAEVIRHFTVIFDKFMQALCIEQNSLTRKTRYFGRYMNLLFRNVSRGDKSLDMVIEYLKVIDDCTRLFGNIYGEVRDNLFCFSFKEMIDKYKRKYSFKPKVIVIECVYLTYKLLGTVDEEVSEILNAVICETDIRKLYNDEPQIFYNLLTLINSGLASLTQQMLELLVWILRYDRNKLSFMNYKQIYTLAETADCNELKLWIKQIWN